MKKIQILLIFCVILGSHTLMTAQKNTLPKEDSVLINCRITQKSPYINIIDGKNTKKVRLSKQYQLTTTEEVKKLIQRGCFTYEYHISNDSLPNYYTIDPIIKKIAIGISAYFMTGVKGDNRINRIYLSRFNSPTLFSRKYSIGLDIYRQVFAANRHRIGLEFELGYNRTTLIMKANSYHDVFDAIDPNRIDYSREVFVSDYEETHHWQSIFIPISLRYDWFFLKFMSIFVSTGLQNEIVVTSNSTTSFNALYSGRYGDEYFNTLIDQTGYYDYGYYGENKFETSDKFPQSHYYFLHTTVSGGIQFFLGRKVSLEFVCLYSKIIYNTYYKTTDNFHLSKSSREYQSMLTGTSSKFGSLWGGKCTLKINF